MLFKSKKLFGANIDPSCTYCLHNSGKAGDTICALQCHPGSEQVCKKYKYDPLMRQPSVPPSVKLNGLDKENFSL